MLPRKINPALLSHQLSPDTLTDWLRRSANPAEKEAYRKATAKGAARPYPRTIEQVKALVQAQS